MPETKEAKVFMAFPMFTMQSSPSQSMTKQAK